MAYGNGNLGPPFTFAVNFAEIPRTSRHRRALSGMPNVKWRRNQARAAKVQKTNREEIGPTFAEIHGSLWMELGRYSLWQVHRPFGKRVSFSNRYLRTWLDYF